METDLFGNGYKCWGHLFLLFVSKESLMCFNECIMTSYVMRQLHEDRNDKYKLDLTLRAAKTVVRGFGMGDRSSFFHMALIEVIIRNLIQSYMNK